MTLLVGTGTNVAVVGVGPAELESLRLIELDAWSCFSFREHRESSPGGPE